MWEIKHGSFLYHYFYFFGNNLPDNLCKAVKRIIKSFIIIGAMWFIVVSISYTYALMKLYDVSEPFDGSAGLIDIIELVRIIIGMLGILAIFFFAGIVILGLCWAAISWCSGVIMSGYETPQFIENGKGFFSAAYKGLKDNFCPTITYVKDEE